MKNYAIKLSLKFLNASYNILYKCIIKEYYCLYNYANYNIIYKYNINSKIIITYCL